ncbi:hypothetical protein BC739_001432 [Kutzneria viridogrisea]|uniref:Uncharacterized protein n=1 Tax=Kutzneria viridogrisea TaxID=47990 RepID=A0ABR6BBH8_9PSEU|nr:hypothetical protein [Kutzneria viridogrisea]
MPGGVGRAVRWSGRSSVTSEESVDAGLSDVVGGTDLGEQGGAQLVQVVERCIDGRDGQGGSLLGARVGSGCRRSGSRGAGRRPADRAGLAAAWCSSGHCPGARVATGALDGAALGVGEPPQADGVAGSGVAGSADRRCTRRREHRCARGFGGQVAGRERGTRYFTVRASWILRCAYSVRASGVTPRSGVKATARVIWLRWRGEGTQRFTSRSATRLAAKRWCSCVSSIRPSVSGSFPYRKKRTD